MASEVLSVPEERLLEVIKIIRAGLDVTERDAGISAETRDQLTKWCDEEEGYITR